MNTVIESIFGNRSAMLVLLFLENYGEGHASRIAKTYGVAVMGIQRQLNRFEQEDVLISQMVGSSRIFKFNERNPTVRNLREFLSKELEMIPKKNQIEYFRQRQRQRRAGKRY